MSTVGPIAKFGVLIAILWAVLSIWRSDTTYHFGPLIIGFTLAAGISLTWYWRALISASATLVLVGIVIALGGLQGPDFFGNNAGGQEAVLATLLGSVLGTVWGVISERHTTAPADNSSLEESTQPVQS